MELGAITQAPGREKKGAETPPYALTKQGRQMAAMPLDPRLSRMLIEAKKEGCLPEVAVIVAALSIQDPRERPAEKQAEADRAHTVFSDPLSDFVSLLNIWNQARRAAGSGQGSTSRLKRFCTTGFLSFRRMREWRDIHAQILTILKEHRWLVDANAHPRELAAASKPEEKKAFSPLYGAIHRSVLSGFLSNIARRKEGNFYQAAKDREAMIFPGSGLFGKAGAWVVAAEMVETSRLYARSVANVDPDWIEPLAGDRCRRTYLEPHWEKKRGQVVATCQVSLYGLILSADRKVAFGPVEPDQAGEIFIREALLTGETRGRFPFISHNLRLVEDIQEMEDKVRRRDILIGEEDLAAFYARRLSGVFDERTLAARIKKAGGDRWLRMREEELIRHRPNEKEMALYPDRITLGGQRFSCDYEFSPGSDRDGVTVKIPAGSAPGVPAEALDWLVPGLVAEKIAALVKGLPKAYRRQLAPVSGAIDTITSEMPTFKGALLPALSRFIHSRFGVRIPPDAWPGSTLPSHLKMRIAVTDHRGKTIAAGRDPSILKQAGNAKDGEDAFSTAKTAHEKTGLRAWDFGDMPESIEVTDGQGHQWTAFPALVPDRETADCVHLRLFLDRSKAEKRHRQGVRVLSGGLRSKDLKFLKRSLKISGYHTRKAAYAQGAQALETGIYEKTVSKIFEKNIRTRADFEALLESGSRELITTGESILAAALSVLDAVHETRATLFELEKKFSKSGHVQALAAEIRRDLEALAPPSFVSLYAPERLPHLVRYIQAMGVRARKGTLEYARDRKWCEQVEPFTDALKKLLESLTPESSDARREAVESFFWMLEEYKISVFAQEIKTDGPVSAKRLNKKLKEIEALY
jgi:ATP-dependent helicase HrpA